MKRTPLFRKTPLKRKPMRRGKGRTRYARRERDIPRMLWCKTQDCSLREIENVTRAEWLGPGPDRCQGIVEAHHAGERAKGQKAPDDTVIPLCKAHHDAIGNRFKGVFSGWPRGTVKAWEIAMIAIYQDRYAEHVARMREVCA